MQEPRERIPRKDDFVLYMKKKKKKKEKKRKHVEETENDF